MNWYPYAVAALLFMGTQRFLYKVSAERRCHTAWTTLSFMTTVAILSSISFLILGKGVVNVPILLLIALVNSTSFLTGTISHIEALRHLPAATVYPIIRLNVATAILFSILFFKDHPTLFQSLGIAMAMSVIFILTRQADGASASGEHRDRKRGFLFVFISLLSGAVALISSKFAAVTTDKMAFMAVSYTLSAIFAFGVRNRLKATEPHARVGSAVALGTAMGVINFAGFYLFLTALSAGPLSIIASITGMHFVIAVLLSACIYKEKPTPLQWLGIALTVVSVNLLRLG